MGALARLINPDDDGGRESKALAKASENVYIEVRLAARKVEGSMALAAHAMRVTEELDQVRRRIAANDEVLNQICAEYELEAVRQAKSVQANLFNKWGL